MKGLLLILCLTTMKVYSQELKYDTIVANTKTKADNFTNAVNWSSIRNKEVDRKEIISKDLDRGFVNSEILVKLFEHSSINFYYSLTFKVDVKDNKYKLSILNPVVRIRMANVDFSALHVKTLMRYRDNIKNLEEVTIKHFDSKMEWDVSKIYQVYTDESMKEEQKGILKKVLNSVEIFNKELSNDCIKFMETSNDW